MQTKELSVKELQLCDRVRQMKLSGMADALEALQGNPIWQMLCVFQR